MKEVPPNRVGETRGGYRIIKKISEGATGEVYEAVDVQLKRRAALKFLHPHLLEHPSFRERFRLEAQATSALEHRNVCAIFGISDGGPKDREPFIAMAFCEGETLAERMGNGPLSLEEVISYGKQIAAGLIAAHAKDIVHRDIKPGNVMVSKDGVVKIVDFGLAKLKEAPTLTRPGSVVGTPLYMSPEQGSGDHVDHRADIWALGAVLYEMITGQAAFYDEIPQGIVYNINNVEPVGLAMLRPEVPTRLVKVVEKALEKDPGSRYGNMSLLLADLEAALLPETATQRRQRFPFLPVALLAALFAALGGLYWSGLWRAGDGVPPSQELPGPENSPPAIALSERSLAYWISVQRYRDGKPYREPFRLERQMVFESDYRIFIHLITREDGYLYVVNEGPDAGRQAPGYNLLFPKTTMNGGEARLAPGQTLQLPESGGFRFDDEVGKEKVWFVWTREPASPLEAVKGLTNPRDLGVIGDEAQARAVREFLAEHSQRPATVESLEAEQMTRLRASGEVLVYPLSLEHR